MDLSHIDSRGQARMVDVAGKEVTVRTAVAEGRVLTTAAAAIAEGTVAKGDVLATARVAGIMGAKRTPDLIPMCHPIAVHGVQLDLEPGDGVVEVRATVKTADRTGVEMEALTAVTVACLTVIDMTKSVDPAATIEGVRVVSKTGGKSGDWYLMKAHVIVCSDSAAAGTTQDTTGPVLVEGLRDIGCEAEVQIVPDEIPAITAAIRAADADVIVCTGGTGLGPRDVTPDAVFAVIDRELPGFGEAFRALGRQQTPLADLSRACAGSMGSTIVVAVPGSHGAVRDALAVLSPLLTHAHAVIAGADHRGLVRSTPITVAEVQAEVRRADAGAVVTFEGAVRNHDHDRAVTSLLYEGHPEADRILREVVSEARGLPGVLEAASLHRVGELAIGDLAFVVAVSAAHRSEAFAACAWLVNAVKDRLPVWKLQRFEDGTQEWVNCA